MPRGTLALVVGSSGAGKDTLIGGARAALEGDARFCFPRRVVTRSAVADVEDHDSVTADAFERHRLRGDYALDWQAHGLSYGIAAGIDAELDAGKIVVVNVSRRILPRATEKYDRCAILLVTARPEIRAARLAARGRESAAEIAGRLAHEGAPFPPGARVVELDNSDTREAGIGRFVDALRQLAD